MSEVVQIDQLERQLRTELEKAERELRKVTPEGKAEARRPFTTALHRFTVFVFEGKLPPDSRCPCP
jgi:hypothetical protein